MQPVSVAVSGADEHVVHKSAAQRARKGLMSIMIGRPVSAVAGILTLVLLSRSLAPEAYGAYFALWAAVEIVVLASNGGLMHAAYRYVQGREKSDGGTFTIIGPLPLLLLLRGLTLVLGALIFLMLPIDVFGVEDPDVRRQLLVAFALMTVAEGAARYCELVCESLLLQVRAQSTTLLRSLFRLVGVGVCLLIGHLGLQQVLIVEVVSCVLAALIALRMLLSLMARSELHRNVTNQGETVTWGRVARFVLPAFASQLLALSYGPDVLKLILNGSADAVALASFGFAFSLVAMVQRYLPVAIFGGLFRPLFVAAAGRADVDTALARLVSMVSKLNWLVIALPLVTLAPCAPRVAALLSKNHYAEAGPVMLILLVGTFFVAWHGVLALYCLAREQSRAPLLATIAAVISLPLSVALVRRFGAEGLALGWGLAEAVWVLVCSLALRGFDPPRLQWVALLKVPALAAVLSIAGLVVAAMWPAFAWPAAIAGPLLFCLLCWRLGVFDDTEIEWFSSVAPQRLQVLFKRGAR